MLHCVYRSSLLYRVASPVAYAKSPLFDDPRDEIASRAQRHLEVSHSIRSASNALQAPLYPPVLLAGQAVAALRKLNPQVGDPLPPTTQPTGPMVPEANDPRHRRPISLPPSPESPPVSFSTAEVIRKVRRSDSASAGGPTGTTYKTLRSWFIDHDQISDSLTQVINLIAGGQVPPSIAPLLNAGRGVAIPKNEAGDLRPIVVGHVLTRLVGSMAIDKTKDTAQQVFLARSAQFGASISDGCSIVAAAIEASLEKHPGTIDIASDAKNAFNTYCRSRIWPMINTYFPSMAPFVRLVYGQESDILVSEMIDDKSTTTRIPSSVGSRQGCSLGSFLFCLAIHPCLNQLKDEFPDLMIIAYCDDVHIVGPPAQAIQAYHRWAYLYSCVVQGELRNDKGVVYSPSATINHDFLTSCGLPADMPVTHSGVRILGAPVGNHDFCRSFAADIVKGITRDLEITERMTSLQCRHTLTTKSTLHRVTHLLRNTCGGEPAVFADVAATYDASLLRVIQGISRCPTLPDVSQRIAHLPPAEGGLGYRPWKALADPAFLAAYTHAAAVFPKLFPHLSDLMPPVPKLLDSPAQLLSHRASMALRAAVRIKSVCPGAIELLSKYRDGSTRSLQHDVTSLLDQGESISLTEAITRLDNPSHPRHRALYYSNRGDSHSWSAIPCDNATIVPNQEYQTMFRRRLLLPTENREAGIDNWMCPMCHVKSDATLPRSEPHYPEINTHGDHAVRCQKAMSTYRTKLWHDPLVKLIDDIGRKCGLNMKMEAYGSVPETGKRPDNLATSPDGAHQTIVDVRTCLVTSPTNCMRAAQTPGIAADLGAAEKMRAWIPVAHPEGFSVIAFCVEEGGRFGVGCETLLDRFSQFLTTTGPDRAAFKTSALQRLHLTNQRGIARVINAMKPLPSDPHVCSFPASYELAPPPPRPQIHITTRPTTRATARPEWASWKVPEVAPIAIAHLPGGASQAAKSPSSTQPPENRTTAAAP